MDRAEKLARLVRELAVIADYPIDRMNEETRLWHDAGIDGEDFWEFMDWFRKEFRLDLTGMDLLDFAPTEGFLWPWQKSRLPYKELRLRDLLDLTEQASWTASGMGERLPRS